MLWPKLDSRSRNSTLEEARQENPPLPDLSQVGGQKMERFAVGDNVRCGVIFCPSALMRPTTGVKDWHVVHHRLKS